MKEAKGDLWTFSGHKVITTNGYIKTNGACVMGRGCAYQAMLKYPKLPFELGELIKNHGNHVYYFKEFNIVTFPVKHNWWEKADLKLIKESAYEILSLTISTNEQFYLPKPGCGNGQLEWEDVKKVIEPILSDQFTVIDYV